MHAEKKMLFYDNQLPESVVIIFKMHKVKWEHIISVLLKLDTYKEHEVT